MITTDASAENTIITLTQNRSASMQQTHLLILFVTFFILLIGIGWTFFGAYLVLPFAGLEIGLFTYFMYKVCSNCHERQVVMINNDKVKVQSGKFEIERTVTFERTDTVVLVTQPELPNDTIGLKISDSRTRFELGAFLDHGDKAKTRSALKAAGLREISDKWWQDIT